MKWGFFANDGLQDVSSSVFAASDNISFTKAVNYENPIPRSAAERSLLGIVKRL